MTLLSVGRQRYTYAGTAARAPRRLARLFIPDAQPVIDNTRLRAQRQIFGQPLTCPATF